MLLLFILLLFINYVYSFNSFNVKNFFTIRTKTQEFINLLPNNHKIFENWENNMLDKSIKILSNNKETINLIIYPGFGYGPESYVELSSRISKICKENDLNINIIITKFFLNSPGFLHLNEGNDRLNTILNYLQEKKYDISKSIIIGHSAGAYIGIKPSIEKTSGFIQMGSVLNSNGFLPWDKNRISTFPKPVLTILGECDGFLRYTLAHDEFNDLKKLSKKFNNEFFIKKKPVVILPGVSHTQMSDGKLTDIALKTGRKDILPDVLINTAHEEISLLIKDFLILNYNTTNINYTKSLDIMDKKIKDSKEFLSYYSNEYIGIDNFSSNCQQLISGLDIIKSINTVYDNFNDFLYSKPTINDDGNIFIHTYIDKKNSISRSKLINQHSPNLWIKMKRKNAIIEHPFYSNINNTENDISAKNINEITYMSIFNKTNSKSKDKFIKFGMKLEFENDLICKNAKEWIDTPLKIFYDLKNNSAKITSPVYYTETNIKPDRFSGMCYMKLLSNSQVIEWITHDSLIN